MAATATHIRCGRTEMIAVWRLLCSQKAHAPAPRQGARLTGSPEHPAQQTTMRCSKTRQLTYPREGACMRMTNSRKYPKTVTDECASPNTKEVAVAMLAYVPGQVWMHKSSQTHNDRIGSRPMHRAPCNKCHEMCVLVANAQKRQGKLTRTRTCDTTCFTVLRNTVLQHHHTAFTTFTLCTCST